VSSRTKREEPAPIPPVLARLVVDLSLPEARAEVQKLAAKVPELLAAHGLSSYLLVRVPRGKKTEIQIVPCATVAPSARGAAKPELMTDTSPDGLTRAVAKRAARKVTAPSDRPGLAAGLAPGAPKAPGRRR